MSNAGPGLLAVKQPRLPQPEVDQAAKPLLRYRVMAFATGVVLLAGSIGFIFYAGDDNPPTLYGLLWVAHGWLFIIYVIITALLGLKLRWPPARYGLVMLAGTIPTMSFVAEHYITRQTRTAASAQPADVRD